MEAMEGHDHSSEMDNGMFIQAELVGWMENSDNRTRRGSDGNCGKEAFLSRQCWVWELCWLPWQGRRPCCSLGGGGQWRLACPMLLSGGHDGNGCVLLRLLCWNPITNRTCPPVQMRGVNAPRKLPPLPLSKPHRSLPSLCASNFWNHEEQIFIIDKCFAYGILKITGNCPVCVIFPTTILDDWENWTPKVQAKNLHGIYLYWVFFSYFLVDILVLFKLRKRDIFTRCELQKETTIVCGKGLFSHLKHGSEPQSACGR